MSEDENFRKPRKGMGKKMSVCEMRSQVCSEAKNWSFGCVSIQNTRRTRGPKQGRKKEKREGGKGGGKGRKKGKQNLGEYKNMGTTQYCRND